jgi:hypothetical protein
MGHHLVWSENVLLPGISFQDFDTWGRIRNYPCEVEQHGTIQKLIKMHGCECPRNKYCKLYIYTYSSIFQCPHQGPIYQIGYSGIQ